MESMREKLIDIVEHTPCVAVSSKTAAGHIADNLIANGVTIPVRCHECRSWERNISNQKEYGTCYCNGFARGIVKHQNGYCDKGQRREDHGI